MRNSSRTHTLIREDEIWITKFGIAVADFQNYTQPLTNNTSYYDYGSNNLHNSCESPNAITSSKSHKAAKIEKLKNNINISNLSYNSFSYVNLSAFYEDKNYCLHKNDDKFKKIISESNKLQREELLYVAPMIGYEYAIGKIMMGKDSHKVVFKGRDYFTKVTEQFEAELSAGCFCLSSNGTLVEEDFFFDKLENSKGFTSIVQYKLNVNDDFSMQREVRSVKMMFIDCKDYLAGNGETFKPTNDGVINHDGVFPPYFMMK